MIYILYSVSFTVLILATVAYVLRARWLPRFPYLYERLPTSFTGDIEAGFSSSAFDLSGNVEAGDSRAGLDDQAKREVRKIMQSRKVDFDEARRIYTQQRFAKNNIGPDGRPRDPKFVSFS